MKVFNKIALSALIISVTICASVALSGFVIYLYEGCTSENSSTEMVRHDCRSGVYYTNN